MGDIDEVSALLGELKSGQSNTADAIKGIQATVAVISDNVKDMANGSVLSKASIEAAHKYIAEIKKELREDIRPFMEEAIAKENQSKGWNDAISWVQGIVGGAIGFCGGYIAKLFGFM